MLHEKHNWSHGFTKLKEAHMVALLPHREGDDSNVILRKKKKKICPVRQVDKLRWRNQYRISFTHILGRTPSTKLAITWWLGGHHGWWGSYISVVIWRWWSKRRIYPSRSTPHCLWLLLRLQLIHQTVHHVYTHRWGRVIIFIDGASASILITVYKHVQECLHRGNTRRTEFRSYL